MYTAPFLGHLAAVPWHSRVEALAGNSVPLPAQCLLEILKLHGALACALTPAVCRCRAGYNPPSLDVLEPPAPWFAAYDAACEGADWLRNHQVGA